MCGRWDSNPQSPARAPVLKTGVYTVPPRPRNESRRSSLSWPPRSPLLRRLSFGASPGVRYYYRVRAKGSYAGSLTPASSYDSGVRKLTAPSDVSASDGDYYGRVHITWNGVAGATQYWVYRCENQLLSSCESIGQHWAPFFDDIGAIPGKQYYYRVRAHSGASGTTS